MSSLRKPGANVAEPVLHAHYARRAGARELPRGGKNERTITRDVVRGVKLIENERADGEEGLEADHLERRRRAHSRGEHLPAAAYKKQFAPGPRPARHASPAK